jgi:hypothetical protein
MSGVKVCDLAQAAVSQPANISTRGFADTGDNVMIRGVIIGGGTSGSSAKVSTRFPMKDNTRSLSSFTRLLALIGFFVGGTTNAAITYPVSFVDPGNARSGYYAAITANIQAAGATWARYLAGSGSIEVEVEFTTDIARVDGASFTNAFVHKNGERDVYEQGAAYELRTGTDVNGGGTPDVRIRINPNYLANELWLDPSPTRRTDPIPANHIDGMSLFIHELAHAFVFSGWMDGTTGALPATYMSTFDEQVKFDGTNFFFIGPNAQAKYGGPVPITYGDPFHVGNSSPRPGADLVNDLMFGPFYSYQQRYDISGLDLAIAKDAGIVLLSESRLLNISTRLRVLEGDKALIGGFIITGSEPKKVLLRGLGPSLPVGGQLQDPTLELFNGSGASIGTNDNWKSDQQSEIKATTIPPSNDLEAAMVRVLSAGNYTAVLRGRNNGIGVGLVEVYDLAQGAASQLANISTRGFVDTGDNVMIGGMIVGGGSAGSSAKVLVRAIGPSLAGAGVSGTLQDPTLELRNANGSLVAQNDNWKSNQEQAIRDTTIPPSDDRESAMVQTLAAGNYTAIVRGKNNTTGIGLVEVYNLQ